MAYKLTPGLVQLPPEGPGYERLTSDEYMTYGHPKLIAAIQQATERTVAHLGAGTRVIVKDLNTADGKVAQGHKTHGPGGKNVDIGYYYTRADNTGVENLFINHTKLPYKVEDGLRVLTKPHPLWNLAANWVLVQELLAIPSVSQILMDKLYATPMEAEAQKLWGAKGTAPDAAKLTRALKVIQWLGNHDNHFHLTVEG